MSSIVSIARTATKDGCVAKPMHIINNTTAAATVTAIATASTKNLNGNYNNNSNRLYTMTNNNNNNMSQAKSAEATASATAVDGNATATVAATTVRQLKTKKPDLAAKIIQETHVVCFDVDSTVITEEGIDELADFCGKGSEVARVTKEAMGGSMTFQDALKIRLNIIRPNQKQIADFIRQRPSTLTRNVKRFVEQLKSNGKQVYLISGGFDCLIAPIAIELGIPLTNLYANKLLFDYVGEYVTFDTTKPTSHSGGKAEAIALIRKKYPNETLITMIGDGATDLEAVPPANYFIGFGGNVCRAEVFRRAQYYVSDFEQLMHTIN